MQIALRFLEVFGLGFFCAYIPGPVLTSLFTETIRGGWEKAKRILIWAAAGELIMSVVSVSVFSLLHPQHLLFSALGIFGSLLLFSISLDLWRLREIQEHEPLFSRRRVFFITLFNGMAWVFWITVCTPQAIQLKELVIGGAWLFIFFFELGWVAASISLYFLFTAFRPYFQSNRMIHLLYRSLSFVFIFFGAKLAYTSVLSLMHLVE
jgi:threonine/homoserine/homoserine lactone efflux protein